MLDEHPDARAEIPSITRLEGSRWRGGRLWSWNRDSRAWTVGDQAAGGARATAAPTRVEARAPAGVAGGSAIRGVRHTPPETCVITWSRPPVVPSAPGGHEVSKLQVTVASRSAERIGPTIIAVPQRGQAHVARVGVSVVVRAVASWTDAGDTGGASTVRARATRAVRQVLARNPDWRMRTKPRGRMCWTKRRRNSIAVSVIV